MAAHSSAIREASAWVPAALFRMTAALAEISSRAADSWPVTPERACTLRPECWVRFRTSSTTPLMRSELLWRVDMASRMGEMTYFLMIRKAAPTSRTPRVRVTALVIREVR